MQSLVLPVPGAEDETYMDVTSMLDHLSQRFTLSYGGSTDEWRSEASIAFLYAYREFKPPLGNHNFRPMPWIYRRVWVRMIDSYRKSVGRRHKQDPRRKKLLQTTEITNGIPTPPTQHRFTDLWDSLTDDAAIVAHLLLDPPKGLLPENPFQTNIAKRVQNRIRKYLVKRKWSDDKIQSAFQTIEEALQ